MTSDVGWMTTTQVAEAAGIDKQRVYAAVNGGSLAAYRIGQVYRFKRAEVEAWLQGDDPRPPPSYDEETKTEGVARYITGDDPEDVAVSLGLSPVHAAKVEEWVRAAGYRVRRR